MVDDSVCSSRSLSLSLSLSLTVSISLFLFLFLSLSRSLSVSSSLLWIKNLSLYRYPSYLVIKYDFYSMQINDYMISLLLCNLDFHW